MAEKEGGGFVFDEFQANKSSSSPVAIEIFPMRLKPSNTFQLTPKVLMAERSNGEILERRLKDREGE